MQAGTDGKSMQRASPYCPCATKPAWTAKEMEGEEEKEEENLDFYFVHISRFLLVHP